MEHPAVPPLVVLFTLLSVPSLLLDGLPFSLSVLGILMAHEMGHYLYARWYGVHTSLPHFIPSPLVFITPNPGTFGAVIVTKAPYPNRQALMDIGAAGPIAGFIVAVPIMAYSLVGARVDLIPGEGEGLFLGEPLVFQALAYLIHGPLPENYTIYLDSVGLAAWFGCLVTMLNLLPVGQLDGGHILYAFTGGAVRGRRLQRNFTIASFLALAVLGMYSPGWWVFGALLLLMGRFSGFRHPTPIDDAAPLPRHSKWLGWLAVLVFIQTCMPVPISFTGP
ncbi:MAG: site-2 protease family protein [Gemmatimonadetes bacterium]|nr:site-2 protease family protein [Gemmatimonadota bacterium]